MEIKCEYCGAFMNDPEVVANAFYEALAKYRACFDVIEFAVYCRPGDDLNFRCFQNFLK